MRSFGGGLYRATRIRLMMPTMAATRNVIVNIIFRQSGSSMPSHSRKDSCWSGP